MLPRKDFQQFDRQTGDVATIHFELLAPVMVEI
jgi:hypothetical protein